MDGPSEGSELVRQLEAGKSILAYPPQNGWAKLVYPFDLAEKYVRYDNLEKYRRLDRSFESLRKEAFSTTTASWNGTRRLVEGRGIQWTGWVADVAGGVGGGSVTIDMDPPGSVSVPEVTLYFDADGAGTALDLRRGQSVVFRGKVESIDPFLGALAVTIQQGRVAPK